MTAAIKVGEVVIFSANSRTPPVTDNIAKVTPKGWIKLAMHPGTWKPNPYRVGEYDGALGTDGTVWLFSDAILAKLTAEHEDYKRDRLERDDERAKQRKERDDRLAAELVEVKVICGGKLPIMPIQGGDEFRILPDGSRLVMLKVPVNPKLADRKIFEIAICRLKDEEDAWDADAKKKVVCHLTYLNGGSDGFPSCSGSRHATDEDALWEAVRHCYFR